MESYINHFDNIFEAFHKESYLLHCNCFSYSLILVSRARFVVTMSVGLSVCPLAVSFLAY